MEKKIKFIIIGLIGAAVIFIFLYMQTLGSKQALQRERQRLIADNAALDQEVQEGQRKAKQLQGQIGALGSELDRLSKEKDEFGKKVDLLSKEKEGLVERLKTQEAAAKKEAPIQAALPQAPVTEDAYWAGILKAKTELEVQLDSLRNELKSTRISNEELQRQKSALELDAKSLQREKEDLKRQSEYNQKLVDSLAQETVRERNDKTQIQESLKIIRNENIILRRQLHSLNNRKINLERKLQELQEGKAAIERRFIEMETMLTEKVSRINTLKEQLENIRSGSDQALPEEAKESVELPPIVVRPQAQEQESAEPALPQTPVRTLEGRVMSINRENNFLVIDLGQDAGIKLGDSLQVYGEDGTAIADIEVIQARKNIAACDIKRESAAISIGNTVR